jgi:hypothetical protein
MLVQDARGGQPCPLLPNPIVGKIIRHGCNRGHRAICSNSYAKDSVAPRLIIRLSTHLIVWTGHCRPSSSHQRRKAFSASELFPPFILWRGSKLGKPSVQVAVISSVVWKARSGQKAPRRNQAIDCPFRRLRPADVERRQLWEKLHFAIGKFVMDPPRHRLPSGASVQPVNEPWQNDTRDRTDPARVLPVPDSPRAIFLVRRTAYAVFASECIDLWRTIGRSDMQPAERVL